MKRPRPRSTSLLLLALALGLVAAACADMLAAERGPPGCYEKVDSVTVLLQRTSPAQVVSADGALTIDVPPLAVAGPTEITISKLSPICAGQPAAGATYLIGPETLVFERPLRLAFKTSALSLAGQPDALRVARLVVSGASAGSWVALDRPERTSSEVLGRSLQAGQFSLVDTSSGTISGVAPVTETSEADVLFSRGDVAAARAAYRAVLQQDSDSARAHLGFALGSLLLLPDAAPARSVLVRCGLPPLEPAALYGANGFLDLLARDRAGESDLQLEFGPSSSPSVGESVVARASASMVTLQVEDRDHLDGPWQLEVAIDLAAAGDAYRAGGVLAGDGFPGHVLLTGPSGRYQLQRPSGGQLQVVSAGRALGQEIALRAVGLTLANGTSGSVRLDGTMRDVIGAPPVPPHALFDSVDDPGPPYRRATAVLLDNCSDALTGPFLFEQARAMLDELSAIETSLVAVLAKVVASDVVEAQAATAALQQAVPSFLLRQPDDLQLNPRDLRLLIAAIDGLRVASDLATPYRFLGHDEAGVARPLADFLAEQTLAYTAADGSIATRAERALSMAVLAADLSRNLLVPVDAGADLVAALSAPRLALDSVLAEAIDALSQPANGPGVFDLDSPLVAPFVDALAGALAKFRETLPASAVPVAVPGNPGYSFVASLFFDQPPTNAALTAQLSGGALCVAEPGSADAASAAERNPQLTLASAARPLLLATLVQLPPDRSSIGCVDDATCGVAGVVCDFSTARCQAGGGPCSGPDSCSDGDSCVGQCQRAPFELIPAADVDRALGGAAPALIDDELWRVIGPLLDALPWRKPI